MANDYCTLVDLKRALRITDDIDDTLLDGVIDAASRWIDGYCERSFPIASGTATRDYIPSGRYEPLYIDDATSVVSVKIDDGLDYSFATTLANGVDFQLEPINGRASGIAWPFSRIVPVEDGYWPVWMNRATVRVEATFGWEAVPQTVRQATLLQASRLFTRYDSPLGIAGFGDMGAMRVSRFADPDVALLLDPYRRLRL